MEPTELTTARLLIRPYRFADVDAVFAYTSDEEWARYLLNVPWPYTREDAEKWIAQCVLADWALSARFLICLDDAPIGGAGLGIDPDNGVAELGYSLASAYWGKGYATEAARAVLDYAFEGQGLEVVFARCDVRNLASVRVMEKLGMRSEGTLRGRVLHRGERIDMHDYGISRDAWAGSGAGVGDGD